MEDLREHPFAVHMEIEAAGLETGAWEKWLDEAELLFGGSLDGDTYTGLDVYSLDDAMDHQIAGWTPSCYVAIVLHRLRQRNLLNEFNLSAAFARFHSHRAMLAYSRGVKLHAKGRHPDGDVAYHAASMHQNIAQRHTEQAMKQREWIQAIPMRGYYRTYSPADGLVMFSMYAPDGHPGTAMLTEENQAIIEAQALETIGYRPYSELPAYLRHEAPPRSQ
jgi:hypothetical protein